MAAGLWAVAVLLSPFLPALAASPRRPARTVLTGPSGGDPHQVAIDHLSRHRRGLRAPGTGGETLELASRRAGKRSGVTHLVYRQRLGGLGVWNGEISVNVDRRGRILSVHDRAAISTHELDRMAVGADLLSAPEALARAAAALGVSAAAHVAVLEEDDAGRSSALEAPGFSLDPIPVALMWLPSRYVDAAADAPRCVWNFVLRPPRVAGSPPHVWEINVDAITGEILTRVDHVHSDRYRVVAYPGIDPSHTSRSLEIDPADAAASPFGWHDANGAPGAEYDDTRGNNVLAIEDQDGDDTGGFRPDGGANHDFDFPLDLAAAPEASEAAAITNAFYWANLLHDIFYRYEFDEASGNFQDDDNGKPGGASRADPLIVEVQDLGAINNAFFYAAPDGTSPKLELGIMVHVGPRLSVLEPAEMAGSFPVGQALFAPIPQGSGVTADVVAAIDSVEISTGGNVWDGCSPFTNAAAVEGKIALIDRGSCDFLDKVLNAEAAGAVGAIIVNIESSQLLDMSAPPDPPSLAIPAVLLGRANGRRLRAHLGGGVVATLEPLADALTQDSAFSTGTIIHEYTHGVSSRLTGGAGTVSCLSLPQALALGEGWSDFLELALLRGADDPRDGAYGVGTFLRGEPVIGGGIRLFPYSTDTTANPLVFDDLRLESGEVFEEHVAGEIWAAALFEMYWNLVDAHGFDPDHRFGYSGLGGNGLAIQLVFDGLATQPCDPSFLDARDAILSADWDLTEGVNQCSIWSAFAKRGMGVDADDGGGAESLDVAGSRAVPVECPEPARATLVLSALAVLAALRRGRTPRNGASRQGLAVPGKVRL